MSYFGDRAQAKADCAASDIQLDGNSPDNTSPVLHGQDGAAGAAPMEGSHEFTKSRTRGRFVGNQGKTRREFPTEGVGSK